MSLSLVNMTIVFCFISAFIIRIATKLRTGIQHDLSLLCGDVGFAVYLYVYLFTYLFIYLFLLCKDPYKFIALV